MIARALFLHMLLASIWVRGMEIPKGKQMPNVGYIGKGYNLLTGNPHSFDGKLDPGFSAAILNLTYNDQVYLEQNSWVIPDSTSGVAVDSCSTEFGTRKIYGMKSYTDSLDGSVSADLTGWGAKFSASVSWKDVKQGTQSHRNVFLQSSATCTAYSVTADVFTPPKVTDNFLAGLNNLPTTYNSETASAFHFFIRYFGTHVMYGAEFGGMYGKISEFSHKAWFRMKTDELHVSVTAKYSSMISAGVNVTDKWKDVERFNSNSTHQYIFTKGGAYSANKTLWMEYVQSLPMPLTYHLIPLDYVVQDRFMPSTADKTALACLPARRASLKKALAHYCEYLKQEGKLSSCEPVGPTPTPENLYMPFAYDYFPAAPIYYNHECPPHAFLTQMWWREQPGKGLVSLKASCSDGGLLRWGDDHHGHWNQVLSCPDGFSRITGKAQQGYGIINVKVACFGEGKPIDFQSNANKEGKWTEPQTCPSDAPVISGLEVMFQTKWPNNHGIVNYRPRCSNGNAWWGRNAWNADHQRRLQSTVLV